MDDKATTDNLGTFLQPLSEIVGDIRGELTRISTVRDQTLGLSRALTRSCALSIRAIHRHEWEEAATMLHQARVDAEIMVAPLLEMPTVYNAGYTQDALKELVEAHTVHAVVRGLPLPTPQEMFVTGATWLRGLSEAATEMRRFVLDQIRRGNVEAALPLLDFMEEVYSQLVTVDFPDAVTDGLRRYTDTLRGVLERTRGDLTLALRQDQMQRALAAIEARLDANMGGADTAGLSSLSLLDEGDVE
jgi:translin